MKKIITWWGGVVSFLLAIWSVGLQASDKKVLMFYTEATYRPFVYMDNNGQVQGFDAQVVRALCKQMQVECELRNAAFDSLIPGLKSGNYDAIFGGLGITSERKNQINFTNPYYFNKVAILAKANTNNSNVPVSDNVWQEGKFLWGKRVGTQTGTLFDEFLQASYGNHVVIKRYASMQSAFLDLQADRIDVVVGDEPVVREWLNGHPKDYVIVATIRNDKYFGEGNGIGLRKDKTLLLNQLNQALTVIKEKGIYQKIEAQYMGQNK